MVDINDQTGSPVDDDIVCIEISYLVIYSNPHCMSQVNQCMYISMTSAI